MILEDIQPLLLPEEMAINGHVPSHRVGLSQLVPIDHGPNPLQRANHVPHHVLIPPLLARLHHHQSLLVERVPVVPVMVLLRSRALLTSHHLLLLLLVRQPLRLGAPLTLRILVRDLASFLVSITHLGLGNGTRRGSGRPSMSLSRPPSRICIRSETCSRELYSQR